MPPQLQTFLDTSSELPKLILVYGPTASGKTSISIDIAQHLNSEVISADSRQIYQGYDIGTGKVTEQEMVGVPHYMIDIVDPKVQYSVGEYIETATPLIEGRMNQGKIPVICGGTGLYIDALLYGFDLPDIPIDQGYRDELETVEKDHPGTLWSMLEKVDPEYAHRLHPNNTYYLIRALEVVKHYGASKLTFSRSLKYDTCIVTPFFESREQLYATINARVIGMFEQGLEDEVKTCLKSGGALEGIGGRSDEDVFKHMPAMKSIGYQEFLPYFRGEVTIENVIEKVQQNSRKYAKRQIAWMRKYERDESCTIIEWK